MLEILGRNGRVWLVAVTLLLLPCLGLAAQRDDDEKVIVRATKASYAAVSALVASLGGSVTYQYENVDALAVSVPRGGLAELTAAVGRDAITKDETIAPPRPLDRVEIASQESIVLGQSEIVDLAGSPQDYKFNNADIKASPLHAAGHTGAGVTVAVIDSGTTNNPAVVPALAGTVIGGENFVPSAPPPASPEPSATSRRNSSHGTWVGTVIAGHANFGFFKTSSLVRSVAVHAPEAIASPCPSSPGICAIASFIPMTGVAPSAKIYALKVLPASGEGAPESRIIAAMDRAITLRRNYDNGVAPVTTGTGSEDDPFVYNSLKIDVVNMSLGGPTLWAGRDLEDQLTRTMVDAGIVVVSAAGNDGFAAMTGGSPGTGLGSITVGASNNYKHERILRDLLFGLGVGALYRPTTHTQTAYFSSRGPTADGRLDPDITANGFATYAQGAAGGISIVSGTSFSAPTVAGAAALLVGSNPSATPFQIRQSLLLSADPEFLGDHSGRIDQGKGYLDVAAAKARLDAGIADGRIKEASATPVVAVNILKAGFQPIRFRNDRYAARVSDLAPGQVAQIFVPSDFWTDRLVVKITNVSPEKPPAEQNQLFGDDFFVNIADAPTSFAELRVGTADNAFVSQDTTFTVDNPQTGLVRVALQGDSTNAGRISADVAVERVRGPQGRPSAVGRIAEGETVIHEVHVPGGAAKAVFEVSWLRSWAVYPTNDLDMVLIPPNGVPNTMGAAANAPERVEIANPEGGLWTVQITGFAVHGSGSEDDDSEAAAAEAEDRRRGRSHGDDDDDDDGERVAKERYALRVTVDGQRLRID